MARASYQSLSGIRIGGPKAKHSRASQPKLATKPLLKVRNPVVIQETTSSFYIPPPVRPILALKHN